jgi:drug/metabolite transporter (DMT)-like permease
VSPTAKGTLLVLGSALMLGTLGLFSRLFYDAGGEPFALLALRFAGVGPALLVLGHLLRERRPTRRGALWGAALGAGQLTIAWALFEGFERAPVALVVLLFYVYPLLVTLAARPLLGEALGREKLAALVIGLAGVALTVGVPESGGAAGILLGLLAGVSLAVVILAARHLMGAQAVGPIGLSGLMFASPLLVVAPWLAVRGADFGPSAEAWGWAAAAVVSAVVPIAFFYAGVRLVGAGTASLLGIGEPFVAVVLAYAVLGESLSALQLVGGALIIGAVALLSVPALRPAPQT